MIGNKEILTASKLVLKGNLRLPMITFVLMVLITCLGGAVKMIGPLAGIIIGGPLMLGYCLFFLAFYRKTEPKVGMLLNGFSYFINALVAYLLMMVFTILWALLLIVPGIIAAMGYSQAFYILADDPNLDGATALAQSKKMMYGHRLQLFYLCCHFIGWFLLSICTLGILLLWVGPYFQTAMTIFYEELKKEVRIGTV